MDQSLKMLWQQLLDLSQEDKLVFGLGETIS